MGSYLTEKDIRNWFNPPLDYDDVSKASIDLQIEWVEDFVKAVYFNDTATTSSKARIPCLLLVVSKIIGANSEIAQKYSPFLSEKLGDYYYTIGSKSIGNPNEIYLAYEDAALRMLRSRTTLAKWDVERVND